MAPIKAICSGKLLVSHQLRTKSIISDYVNNHNNGRAAVDVDQISNSPSEDSDVDIVSVSPMQSAYGKDNSGELVSRAIPPAAFNGLVDSFQTREKQNHIVNDLLRHHPAARSLSLPSPQPQPDFSPTLPVLTGQNSAFVFKPSDPSAVMLRTPTSSFLPTATGILSQYANSRGLAVSEASRQPLIVGSMFNSFPKFHVLPQAPMATDYTTLFASPHMVTLQSTPQLPVHVVSQPLSPKQAVKRQHTETSPVFTPQFSLDDRRRKRKRPGWVDRTEPPALDDLKRFQDIAPEIFSWNGQKPMIHLFLLKLLDNSHCRHVIEWVNKQERLFKVITPSIIAKLWQHIKGNKTDNYECFARGIRHSRDIGKYFESHDYRKKKIYKFSIKAMEDYDTTCIKNSSSLVSYSLSKPSTPSSLERKANLTNYLDLESSTFSVSSGVKEKIKVKIENKRLEQTKKEAVLASFSCPCSPEIKNLELKPLVVIKSEPFITPPEADVNVNLTPKSPAAVSPVKRPSTSTESVSSDFEPNDFDDDSRLVIVDEYIASSH